MLRHHLSEARQSVQRSFDGLCGIVSKDGVCYQCSGLRDAAPEGRRGPAVPELGGHGAPSDVQYRLRLTVVRDVDIDAGATQSFHDAVWKTIETIEQQRAT